MNIRHINYITSLLFTICYAYQLFYIPVSLFLKNRRAVNAINKRYAILICARNEENVIGDLIDSIHEQDYPQDKIDVYVMADNCTDDTFEIAKSKGAYAFERHSSIVGKGYALQKLLDNIKEEYDGYLVFDADNILSKDYIKEINKSFADDVDAITSYRNSKNYGSNWVSAGYALWFLRESQFLNKARTILNTSAAVSGTGFMISNKLLKEMGGWNYHLLTEDIEFSVDQIAKGKKIIYCEKAEFFDEQPTDFKQSITQRIRWTKGNLQVFSQYGGRLIEALSKGIFGAFDMLMAAMPAFFLSMMSFVLNLFCLSDIMSFAELIGNAYAMMFFLGLITTLSEWKHIRCTTAKKILYLFTFPLFMGTYIPICFLSLFAKADWKPIKHQCTRKNMGF